MVHHYDLQHAYKFGRSILVSQPPPHSINQDHATQVVMIVLHAIHSSDHQKSKDEYYCLDQCTSFFNYCWIIVWRYSPKEMKSIKNDYQRGNAYLIMCLEHGRQLYTTMEFQMKMKRGQIIIIEPLTFLWDAFYFCNHSVDVDPDASMSDDTIANNEEDSLFGISDGHYHNFYYEEKAENIGVARATFEARWFNRVDHEGKLDGNANRLAGW